MSTSLKHALVAKVKAQRDSSLDSTSTSSSSEDHPLRETPTGTKRKAEVLKESGKIGVTIKTSPPMATSKLLSPSTAPPHSPSSSAGKTSGAGQTITPQKAVDPPKSPAVPPTGNAKILESSARESAQAKQSTGSLHVSVPVANRSQTNKNATEPQAPLSPETPASRPESNTPPELALAKEKATGQAAEEVVNAAAGDEDGALVVNLDEEEDEPNNNNVCPEKISRRELPMSPKTVAPRLWLPKNRNTDQVFITDVTVNLQTVTIRECKTEQGFFREREMNSTTT